MFASSHSDAHVESALEGGAGTLPASSLVRLAAFLAID
jgi:hypothetical protein